MKLNRHLKAFSVKRIQNDYICFSIIIPTYRRPNSLRKTLLSLMNLDYPAEFFEIIVIINDPYDSKSKTLVNKFKKLMKNLSHYTENNAGASFARNTGVVKAKYHHLLFIDDDIRVKKLLLRGYNLAWSKYPDAKALGGSIIAINIDLSTFTAEQEKLINKYSWCFAHINRPLTDMELDLSKHLFSSNISYRLEDKNEIVFSTKFGVPNIFAFDGLFGAEDVELNVRTMLNGNKCILLSDQNVEVEHAISLNRFSRQYLFKRHLQAGVETYILDRFLKKSFLNYRSYYLKKLLSLNGIKLLLLNNYERAMLIGYLYIAKRIVQL